MNPHARPKLLQWNVNSTESVIGFGNSTVASSLPVNPLGADGRTRKKRPNAANARCQWELDHVRTAKELAQSKQAQARARAARSATVPVSAKISGRGLWGGQGIRAKT
jgi:hypothetical protein